MDAQKMLILDGNSLAHRAFHALPMLTNSQGVVTNAAFGFTNMLLKILKEENPDYVVVAFDKGKTFRHEKYADYKGTRQKTPQELKSQFPLIWKILEAMKIAMVQLEGYEADDLIGTLAKKAEEKGIKSLIVTGDRDALQLITSLVEVLITRRGITKLEKYDYEAIKKEYDLEPHQLRDVKGLMGDNSDNIPGIPGIGPKTAVKLIKEYGSIENLLANLDQHSSKKQADKIRTYADQALLSKELGTIDCAVSLEMDLEECRYQEPDYSALLEIFKELEFNSLIKEILDKINTNPELLPQEALEVNYIKDSSEFIKLLKNPQSSKIALSFSLKPKDPLKGKVLAIGLAGVEDKIYCFQCQSLEITALSGVLEEIFTNPEREVICHDLKGCLTLLRRSGFKGKINGKLQDTMLAAYLLNPTASDYELGKLSLEYLNKPFAADDDNILEQTPLAAQRILELSEVLLEKLEEAGMKELYRQVELPLVKVLSAMELEGIKLDREQLLAMGQELSRGIDALTTEIYQLAGEEFNINSPKQLGVILFEKLNLPPLKKTKTGYSTSAEVLEELAEKHEIVAKILEYRQLMKLKSTYVDGLLNLVNSDTGKVHTTFNQTITATGRLSSTEPNLQNIPIRLEVGRRLRKVFIPSSPENLLVAADYSQIELRVLAHISQDENLIEAFIKEQDIHTRTASLVFGVPMEQVTPDMRYRAKAVNFGIVYGISDFGLSKDLRVSRKEAQEYIDLYFARYPGVKKYMEEVVAQARKRGYVTTLLNRRRYLPELFSSNRNIRNFGERAAINTPIQGSAADIIKLAMLKVCRKLEQASLKITMLLQVHDELIFEVPKKELKPAVEIIREAMESAYQLKVPLKVDVKAGPNWYDMEEVR